MHTQEQLLLLLILVAVLSVAGYFILFHNRRTPQERDRRQRKWVNLHGRLGYATITDFHDDTLYYSYEVRGVVYTAAQDVSRLKEFLPPEPERLIGLANLKYHPRNPANSILICEDWSGIRPPEPARERAV